jgi:teichuronic acid biosynthesis glycosyltransferase TuaG
MQNTNPFVSIVVTTYNRKELLKETVDSILSQSHENFELIIVDNYSNYNFLELIESFNDKRINAYQNTNNGIIAINRNFGIKKAKGEYIAFCDDDDIWYPNKLEVQLSFFNDTEIIGVGSVYDILSSESSKVIRTKKIKDKVLDFKQIIMDNSGVALSSLVIKNKLLLFDEGSEFFAIEDYAFQVMICFESKSKILRLGKPLLKYRLHGNNNSSLQQVVAGKIIIEKYKEYLQISDLKLSLQVYYYQIGKKYRALGKMGDAKRFFSKAASLGFTSFIYMIKIQVAYFMCMFKL